MILETDRLTIKELTNADFDNLCLILQDNDAMYAYEGAFSDDEVKEWLNKQLSRYSEYGFGLWALFDKISGDFIGQCGLTMQEANGRMIPEIGYLLRRKYWHNGYATEAASACRDYAFRKYGFNRLYTIIRDTNTASQKVAIRIGMTAIETCIRHFKGIDMPHIIYAIDNPALQYKQHDYII